MVKKEREVLTYWDTVGCGVHNILGRRIAVVSIATKHVASLGASRGMLCAIAVAVGAVCGVSVHDGQFCDRYL
jgi:hypothetical protein